MGIFDINPKLQGLSIRDIPIRDIEELEEFIANNNVDILALTLPKKHASEMANMLVDYGIKAFWNFALVDLNFSDDIVVENVHLAESLMQLSYALTVKVNSNKE